MIVLLLVAGSLYLSYLFSYLYLWTVSPAVWPAGRLLALAGMAGDCGRSPRCERHCARGSGTAPRAGRAIAAGHRRPCRDGTRRLERVAHHRYGERNVERAHPQASAYGAMVYTAAFLQLEIVLPVVLMGLFLIARLL